MVIKTIKMFWQRIPTMDQWDGIPQSQDMHWPNQSFENKLQREEEYSPC